MTNNDSVIKIHKIVQNHIVSTTKYDQFQEIVIVSHIPIEPHTYEDGKLCLKYFNLAVAEDQLVLSSNEDGSGSSINLPTLIRCQNCETNFPTKYQYQRHKCDCAEPISGQFKCSVCHKEFPNLITMEQHRGAHCGNVCEFCGKRFVSDNRLRIHKENHCKKAGEINKFYRSDVTVWKCKECCQVFSCQDNATRHQRNLNEIETVSTELILQCEFCNRTYSDKNHLLMHQRQHTTTKNYECIHCFKAFDCYNLAASHWIRKCSDSCDAFYLPKLLYCEFCDGKFKSHDLLYNHKIKKRHYTPKLYVALDEETKKNGENANNAINQLIKDVLRTLDVEVKEEPNRTPPLIEEEPTEESRKRKLETRNHNNNAKKSRLSIDEGFKYQCERCIKVFGNVEALENHRHNIHATTFCCEECGQTLGTAKALLIHSRLHKNLKPYVCDTCERSYSQTSHLWQHMRFHQGIKPFACPHEGCEARYTIRPDLKDHIRKVHTRERPFKCNVCNKCFLTGSVYYQHRLIHTNDRRYGCDICDKRFFRADALNNHRRIHTDERPYPCFVCSREFRQKGDRNKHLRTQHPDQCSGPVVSLSVAFP